MTTVEKRHSSRKGRGHRKHGSLNDKSSGGSFLDDTDREVSSLTDRAFRSLCIGEEAVYNDSDLGSSPSAQRERHQAFSQEVIAISDSKIWEKQEKDRDALKRAAHQSFSLRLQHYGQGGGEAGWERKGRLWAGQYGVETQGYLGQEWQREGRTEGGLSATFQRSFTDVSQQEKTLSEERLSFMSNGGSDTSWQQRRSHSRVSSLIKAFSSEGYVGGDGGVDGKLRDGNNECSWDKSALISIQSELSEFSTAYHHSFSTNPFLSAGSFPQQTAPYPPCRNSLYPSELSSSETSCFMRSSQNKLSSKHSMFNQSNSTSNLFLHSEFSPFQPLWRENKKFPFHQGIVSGFLSQADFPKWYDSPMYKELTLEQQVHGYHRFKETGSRPQHKTLEAVAPPSPLRSTSTVLQKASSTERHSDYGLAGHYPPWKRAQSVGSNRYPSVRPSTVSPTNERFQRGQDVISSLNELKQTERVTTLTTGQSVTMLTNSSEQSSAVERNNNKVPSFRNQVSAAAVQQTVVASNTSTTPFNITQMLTPVIPYLQDTDTRTEGLHFALEQHPGLCEKEKRGPTPEVRMSSYKSRASGLLFNLKDNRKRVKSTYSPTQFKGLEVTGRSKSNLDGYKPRDTVIDMSVNIDIPFPQVSAQKDPYAVCHKNPQYDPSKHATTGTSTQHWNYTDTSEAAASRAVRSSQEEIVCHQEFPGIYSNTNQLTTNKNGDGFPNSKTDGINANQTNYVNKTVESISKGSGYENQYGSNDALPQDSWKQHVNNLAYHDRESFGLNDRVTAEVHPWKGEIAALIEKDKQSLPPHRVAMMRQDIKHNYDWNIITGQDKMKEGDKQYVSEEWVHTGGEVLIGQNSIPHKEGLTSLDHTKASKEELSNRFTANADYVQSQEVNRKPEKGKLYSENFVGSYGTLTQFRVNEESLTTKEKSQKQKDLYRGAGKDNIKPSSYLECDRPCTVHNSLKEREQPIQSNPYVPWLEDNKLQSNQEYRNKQQCDQDLQWYSSHKNDNRQYTPNAGTRARSAKDHSENTDNSATIIPHTGGKFPRSKASGSNDLNGMHTTELAKAQNVKAEKINAVQAKAEIETKNAKADKDIARAEQMKAEIAIVEPSIAEKAKSDLENAEKTKAELDKAKAQLTKAEHSKAKIARTEKAKHELANLEIAKAQAQIAQAELAKAELGKAQAELAKAELAKAQADLAKAELVKAQAELAKAELAKAQAKQAKEEQAEEKAKQVKVEIIKAECAKAEIAKTQTEFAQAELAKSQLKKAKAEEAEAEKVKSELATSELAKDELAEVELAKSEAMLTEAEKDKSESSQAESAKSELANAKPATAKNDYPGDSKSWLASEDRYGINDILTTRDYEQVKRVKLREKKYSVTEAVPATEDKLFCQTISAQAESKSPQQKDTPPINKYERTDTGGDEYNRVRKKYGFSYAVSAKEDKHFSIELAVKDERKINDAPVIISHEMPKETTGYTKDESILNQPLHTRADGPVPENNKDSHARESEGQWVYSESSKQFKLASQIQNSIKPDDQSVATSKDEHPSSFRPMLIKEKGQTKQEILTSKLKAHAEKEISAIKEKGFGKRDGLLLRKPNKHLEQKEKGQGGQDRKISTNDLTKGHTNINKATTQSQNEWTAKTMELTVNECQQSIGILEGARNRSQVIDGTGKEVLQAMKEGSKNESISDENSLKLFSGNSESGSEDDSLQIMGIIVTITEPSGNKEGICTPQHPIIVKEKLNRREEAIMSNKNQIPKNNSGHEEVHPVRADEEVFNNEAKSNLLIKREDSSNAETVIPEKIRVRQQTPLPVGKKTTTFLVSESEHVIGESETTSKYLQKLDMLVRNENFSQDIPPSYGSDKSLKETLLRDTSAVKDECFAGVILAKNKQLPVSQPLLFKQDISARSPYNIAIKNSPTTETTSKVELASLEMVKSSVVDKEAKVDNSHINSIAVRAVSGTSQNSNQKTSEDCSVGKHVSSGAENSTGDSNVHIDSIAIHVVSEVTESDIVETTIDNAKNLVLQIGETLSVKPQVNPRQKRLSTIPTAIADHARLKVISTEEDVFPKRSNQSKKDGYFPMIHTRRSRRPVFLSEQQDLPVTGIMSKEEVKSVKEPDVSPKLNSEAKIGVLSSMEQQHRKTGMFSLREKEAISFNDAKTEDGFTKKPDTHFVKNDTVSQQEHTTLVYQSGIDQNQMLYQEFQVNSKTRDPSFPQQLTQPIHVDIPEKVLLEATQYMEATKTTLRGKSVMEEREKQDKEEERRMPQRDEEIKEAERRAKQRKDKRMARQKEENRKEAEKIEIEKREEEKKEEERRDVEKDKRMELQMWREDKRVAEKKEAERKEAEMRQNDRRLVDKKEMEKREEERKEKRKEKERREDERKEVERKEKERKEKDRREERKEKERKENERREKERNEKERKEKERSEEERKKKQRREEERKEEERKEKERKEEERKEKERIEKERRVERREEEKKEEERREEERREEERKEKERREEERRETERREEERKEEIIEKERREEERREKERKEERKEKERREEERKEKERIEKERREEERREKERKEKERKEKERREEERKEKERREEERREEKRREERKEKEINEKERREKEKREEERREEESKEKERKEEERKEKERREEERREEKRKEKERKEKERKEKERREKERREEERREEERKEKERNEKERKEKERREKERREDERREEERREEERREEERKEVERKLEKKRGEEKNEAERKERREKERREENERKELQKQREEDKKELEMKELERRELQKKKAEKIEKERKEMERREQEKKEEERKQADVREMERRVRHKEEERIASRKEEEKKKRQREEEKKEEEKRKRQKEEEKIEEEKKRGEIRKRQTEEDRKDELIEQQQQREERRKQQREEEPREEKRRARHREVEKMDALQYYSISSPEKQGRPRDRSLFSPEPSPRKGNLEDWESHVRPDYLTSPAPSSTRSNTSSPAFGCKPIMFRVKDNTFRSSSLTKSVKPRFHKSFGDEFRVGSPLWSGSERGDEVDERTRESCHEAQREHTGTLEYQESSVLSLRNTCVQETHPSNEFIASSEQTYTQHHSRPYSRRSVMLEDYDSRSMISNMSEDVESCATSVADISERSSGPYDAEFNSMGGCDRPNSACSFASDLGRPLGKPPAVLPKSEKALRRAKRLTTRRIMKESNPETKGVAHPVECLVREVVIDPSSPLDHASSDCPARASAHFSAPISLPLAPSQISSAPIAPSDLCSSHCPSLFVKAPASLPIASPHTGVMGQVVRVSSPTTYHHPAHTRHLVSPLASPPTSSVNVPQYHVEPTYTSPSALSLAQPFTQSTSQKKVLQDPGSGQYFVVEMPIQVKTKTFFDPETGNYVQLNVRQPGQGGSQSQAQLQHYPQSIPQPQTYPSYTTPKVRSASRPYVLYQGYSQPMPVNSLSTHGLLSGMPTSEAATQDPHCKEKCQGEGWINQGYIDTSHNTHTAYNTQLHDGAVCPDGTNPIKHRDIITMSELEDFAMDSGDWL